MKICLDARGNYLGGVLTYSYSVLKKLSEKKLDHEFLVLIDEYQDKENLFIIKDMDKLVIPQMNPLRMLIWNNFRLPSLLKEKGIDIYHGFKHFTLRGNGARVAFSLRSASWWLYPDLFKRSELFFWRMYYALGAKFADLVFTTSESDKNIFIENQNINPDKVVAIHQAADPRFVKITDSKYLAEVKRKFSLPDKYFLFVGTIYPFKNIETVIRSFALVKEQGQVPHQLVIVGGASPAYGEGYKEDLKKLAAELKVDKDIVWTGAIFQDLPAVFTLADIFIFPSLYESHTKPPIEAMSCGVPVITSGEGGIPEVVGDAAIICGHLDCQGIASSIHDVMASAELRRGLIEKGYRQAEKFSWERCVRETVDIYEQMAASK